MTEPKEQSNPVAWMHPISGAVIKASERVEGGTMTDFSIPLGPISSYEAYAALISMKAVEVCERISLKYQWDAEDGKLGSIKWNRDMWKSRAADECAEEIKALIPADHMQAVRELIKGAVMRGIFLGKKPTWHKEEVIVEVDRILAEKGLV